MNTFWTLLKESVIVQALLTLILWCAVVYMVVIGQPVPDILSIAATTVLGFYFGSRISLSRAQKR